jgi:hypothetical protein
LGDFFSFRWMITPWIVQGLFVLGCIAAVATGGFLIGNGIGHHDGGQISAGVVTLLLGPVVVRLYAEFVIVIFRINDSLSHLRALAVWAAERAAAAQRTEPE